MLVALLVFWPNCAKILLIFPNNATLFFKLCSLKNMVNRSKNAFSLIRSRLFLLAIYILFHVCLLNICIVFLHFFLSANIFNKHSHIYPFCNKYISFFMSVCKMADVILSSSPGPDVINAS